MENYWKQVYQHDNSILQDILLVTRLLGYNNIQLDMNLKQKLSYQLHKSYQLDICYKYLKLLCYQSNNIQQYIQWEKSYLVDNKTQKDKCMYYQNRILLDNNILLDMGGCWKQEFLLGNNNRLDKVKGKSLLLDNRIPLDTIFDM